jgi:peptide/nickel transport system substrate-binding protein
MGITDYAHHGTPNAHLIAPLRSDGTWNAAHYKNPTYDRQVASYIAALDLDSQRKAAGELQKTLLDDTPVLFAYFTDALAAAKKGLNGVQISPLGQVWLAAASLAG